MMTFEGFLVVLNFCLFLVARPNESLKLHHGVRVRLLWFWGEGGVSKEILVDYVVGAATTEPLGGRPTLEKRQKTRDFNPTKGFPGEDIL